MIDNTTEIDSLKSGHMQLPQLLLC